MKIILKIVSFIGLLLTLFPSFFVFLKTIEFDTHKNLMLLGTVMWFATAPFWMNKKRD